MTYLEDSWISSADNSSSPVSVSSSPNAMSSRLGARVVTGTSHDAVEAASFIAFFVVQPADAPLSVIRDYTKRAIHAMKSLQLEQVVGELAVYLSI